MPQDLAALLVEEGAVSQADMERAVARQAQLGGALDTALLELSLIGEGHLLSFLAHATGLPAAPLAALSDVDPRARRVFPAKVAERHRLAPFALDGRELSVVAVHPVDGAAVDEIGFMLSLTLVPHVCLEWRVHELIQRLYGGQLPVRLARLSEALQAAAAQPPPPAAAEPAPASAPAAPPPAGAARSSVSIEDAFFAAGEEGSFAAAAPAPAEPPPAAPEPQTEPEPEPEAAAGPGAEPAAVPSLAADPEPDETSFADIEPERHRPSGFERDGAEPQEPLLAALEQAVDLYEALWAEPAAEPAAAAAADGAPAPAAPGQASGEESPPAPAAELPVAPVAPVEAGAEGSAPGDSEEPEPPPALLDRAAPPRWTLDDALVALSATSHRDEVVLVALRYARDFFEFAALFAVTRDAVVGHDALGLQEEARTHARSTALYAADPGIVRTVLETRAPYLGPVVRDALGTTNVLDGLWRGTPRTVLLYPILVGERPVAVLYADNGDAPVSARRLSDLLLLLSTIGATFERIIRARKRRTPRGRAAPASPVETVPPGPATVEPSEPSEPSEPPPDWMAPPPAPDGAAVSLAPDAPPAPPDEPPSAPPTVPPDADPPAAVEVPPEAPEPQRDAPPDASPPGPAPAPQGTPAEASPAPATPSALAEAAMAALLAGGPDPVDAAAPILELVLDPRPDVAAAARAALVAHRGERAVKPIPERLRRALLSGLGDRPVLAAMALGALRDVESIPILIQALEGSAPAASAAAADALARITLQRLGPSAQKWLRWWKENRGRTRAEWLFAALTSPERDLRVDASDELRAAGEPPVRYVADMPLDELEGAARAWWTWWARQGLRI